MKVTLHGHFDRYYSGFYLLALSVSTNLVPSDIKVIPPAETENSGSTCDSLAGSEDSDDTTSFSSSPSMSDIMDGDETTTSEMILGDCSLSVSVESVISSSISIGVPVEFSLSVFG